MLAEIPNAGNPADARADFLYRAHEWIGKKRQPQRGESKLRARLGVGGYPAEVVVRRAGNQPGTHERHVADE